MPAACREIPPPIPSRTPIARIFAPDGDRPYSGPVRRPWVPRLAIALVIAVALGWLPYQFYGRSGLSRLLKLRAEAKALHDGNVALRARNAALRADLAIYDDDALGAVERIARDELGFIKPGEIVFKIEDEPRQARVPPAYAAQRRPAP